MKRNVSDVAEWIERGRVRPGAVFPQIRRLAASEQWQEREVAATALVEIVKKQPLAVLTELRTWVNDPDPNVRRASCEGLRGLVRTDPESVAPTLAALRGDPSIYVRKSVANLLRDASKKHAGFVLSLVREWAPTADRPTAWVIREGLRKLVERA